MELTQKAEIEKKLIAIEIELGFLRVPSEGKRYMLPESGTIGMFWKEGAMPVQHKWDYKNQRIYGLKGFYRENDAKPGDKVHIEFIGGTAFRIKLLRQVIIQDTAKEEISEQEAEEIIDLSGLSSQAKGDIVEDRIKELVLLYGQGLLNVYKPTNDTEGIDLIVIKNGIYQPLFLQVKSNYKLHGGRNLLVQVADKTLNPHHTLFIVGAYFNPKELELDEKVALIPSEAMHREGTKIKLQGSHTGHRMMIPLKDGSRGKHTSYLIKKTEFVNKLLEKFSEIEKYLK